MLKKQSKTTKKTSSKISKKAPTKKEKNVQTKKADKAKSIIRSEIRSYGWNAKSLKKTIDDFRKYDRSVYDGYSGGDKLVQDGNFACYNSQTDDMLGKIYGKREVSKWSDEKKWNTYKNLLSREIDSVYKSGRMNLKKRK